MTATVRPLLTLAAVIVMGIHAYRRKDLESLAWFLIVAAWAL